MFADCHTHLDQYDSGEMPGILARAHSAGVGLIISAGTTVGSSGNCVGLAMQHPMIFAGVGIHPMDIRKPFYEADYASLKGLAIGCEKVLAMSEIGLDFMEGTPSRDLQYNAFREQIRLARELSLPIVFHSREAHDETLRVLQEEKAYEVGAVMHYFQADESVARKCLELDFYISLGRPLLRLPHLQKLVASFPTERIVLETDAFPQPFKKKRENWTEPRHIAEIASKVAELKGIQAGEVEQFTTENMLRLLGKRAEIVKKHVSFK